MEHEKQVSNNDKSYNGNPPGMAFLMGEDVYQERWGPMLHVVLARENSKHW